MIKCPICGKLNEDDAKWCNNCGTGLVDKGIVVKPKRKKRLWLWIPLGVILGLLITGITPDNSLVEVMEWSSGSWGIGVQFHPEFRSKPTNPHPLFSSFIKESMEKQQ